MEPRKISRSRRNQIHIIYCLVHIPQIHWKYFCRIDYIVPFFLLNFGRALVYFLSLLCRWHFPMFRFVHVGWNACCTLCFHMEWNEKISTYHGYLLHEYMWKKERSRKDVLENKKICYVVFFNCVEQFCDTVLISLELKFTINSGRSNNMPNHFRQYSNIKWRHVGNIPSIKFYCVGIFEYHDIRKSDWTFIASYNDAQ